MATRYVDLDRYDGLQDGTSWTDAWLDLQSAMNAIAGLGAGPHVVKVRGSNTYSDDGSGGGNSYVFRIETNGTSTAPVTFQGRNSDDTGPALVTADANVDTQKTNCLTTILSGEFHYYRFEEFRFTGASVDGVALNTGNSDGGLFVRCRFDNNGGNGFIVDQQPKFQECEFDNNSAAGCSSDLGCVMVACSLHDNGSWGYLENGSGEITAYSCEFYNNTTGAISSQGPSKLFGVTIDGRAAGTGLLTNGSEHLYVLANVSVYNNSTGINFATTADKNVLATNIHVDSNTANYTNFATPDNEVSGIPRFINSAGGDYKLQSHSPLKAAGVSVGNVVNNKSHMDIGAHQIVAGTDTSDYAENQILDYVLRDQPDWAPTAIYVGLFSSDPHDDQDYFGQELFGDGYVRQTITFGSPNNGIITNNADITFPVATSYWSTITHFGLFDTETDGNMIFSGEFTAGVDVPDLDQLTISAGNLTITMM